MFCSDEEQDIIHNKPTLLHLFQPGPCFVRYPFHYYLLCTYHSFDSVMISFDLNMKMKSFLLKSFFPLKVCPQTQAGLEGDRLFSSKEGHKARLCFITTCGFLFLLPFEFRVYIPSLS